jgi:hypothetical protein
MSMWPLTKFYFDCKVWKKKHHKIGAVLLLLSTRSEGAELPVPGRLLNSLPVFFHFIEENAQDCG